MATDGPPAAREDPETAGGDASDGGAADDVPPGFEAYAEEDVPQASVGAPGKTGELELTFAPDRGEKTRLVRDYVRVPYHLSGTLDHDRERPDFATVYVQNPTGGMAQGDRTEMRVTAEPGARAHVGAGSATKVLAMTTNYASEMRAFDVGDGAHVEHVPEQTILHEGSRYAQETTVTLGEDATAILADVLVPGRLARDEAFAFERYHARTTVAGPSGRLFRDTTRLAPGDPSADPRLAGIMGGRAVVGTCYVATTTDADSGALSDQLHDRVTGTDGDAVQAGASALPRDSGVLVRALGDRACDVRDTLVAAWDEASEALLGAGAPDERKN